MWPNHPNSVSQTILSTYKTTLKCDDHTWSHTSAMSPQSRHVSLTMPSYCGTCSFFSCFILNCFFYLCPSYLHAALSPHIPLNLTIRQIVPCKTIFKARVFVNPNTSQFSNLDHHHQPRGKRLNVYVSYPVHAGGQLTLRSVSTRTFCVLNSESIPRVHCKKWSVCVD